ncbi:MAG: hypothetical protein ACFFER_02640 [Candidatus Thorarchaeota archaeon]
MKDQSNNPEEHELKKYLIEKYRYNDWKGKKKHAMNHFIWKFFFSGIEFPTWSIHKSKLMKNRDWPSTIKSLWKKSDENADDLLRVNFFECASRNDAHEFLLDYLGEFESPTLEPIDDLGDIAFGTSSLAAVLVARANVVFQLSSVGKKTMRVDDIASGLDDKLTFMEDSKAEKVRPDFLRFKAEKSRFSLKSKTGLKVEATDPLGRPVWYWFESKSGQIYTKNGQLVYHPEEAGDQKITALAINENSGIAKRSLELIVDED